MEKWNNPELNELGLECTKETKCYCDNGIDEETITYKGGKPHRPGHCHKPDRPEKPCPPTPCPPPPGNDDSDDPVIPES